MDLRIKTFEEYQNKYTQSVNEPELFWSEIANQFSWKKKWETTLEWNFGSVANGVYLVKIKIGDQLFYRSATIMK